MRKRRLIVFIYLLGLISGAGATIHGKTQEAMKQEGVTVGAERFEAYVPLLQGQRVGFTGNHTSLAGGRHVVDCLLEQGVRIARIYSPEHGFRGTADAGAHVDSDKDPATGIAIVSLYGKSRKPSAAQLEGIDIMVFDMQDVGLRFFTYISTLFYVMEACAEQGIPVVVLDRPNPNGFYVDGPLPEPGRQSFVCLLPVPVVHGMSLGELAQMINGEKWLSNGLQCPLTVIPCRGYTHQTLYHLPVSPSPNLPGMQAIYLYPSTCFFEGTALSLGRGTDFAFEVFGHPGYKGIYDFTFTPRSRPGAMDPPLKDQLCYGVDLRSFPSGALTRTPRLRVEWLIDAYRRFPHKERFFSKYFTTLWGSARIQQMITDGLPADRIRASWTADVERFTAQRRPYLLYAE